MIARGIAMARAIVLLALAPIVLLAQEPPGRDVDTLIKNLGSSNFKVRQAAFAALKERPDALPELQKALKSPDREVAKRASEVLEFFNRKPVRELDDAVNNGQLERFVDLMLGWPDGKYEAEAWKLVCGFAKKLRIANGRTRGSELWLGTERVLGHLEGRSIPLRIREKRIIGLASGIKDAERKSGAVYLCADEVDLTYRLDEKPPSYRWAYNAYTGAIIAKNSVHINLADSRHVVFSGGRVELTGGDAAVLVVSAGDVVIDAEIGNSLVIAKGNIIIKRNRIERTRLIAGKKVITDHADRDTHESVLISENDPNPLGFIRWADATKGKMPTKAK